MLITAPENGTVKATHFKYFIRSILLLLSVISIPVAYFCLLEIRHDNEVLKREQLTIVGQRQQLLREYFRQIQADLFFLAQQNELVDSSEAQISAAELAREYLSFVRAHENYDQVRFLNLDGQEVVRANYNYGEPYLVPEQELQNKQHRYYFQDSIRLGDRGIFTSVFDLNMENRKVEIPHKPMIRFATPVFSEQGQKLGVIIINYLGEYLLNAIRQGSELSAGQMMLLNPQGYWLLHPDQEKMWGFMNPDSANERFSLAYPQAWKQMNLQQQGQFETAAGIFTFTTIASLSGDSQKTQGSGSAETLAGEMQSWKLVSFIPRSYLAGKANRLQLLSATAAGLLVLLLVFPAWRFSRALARRSYYHAEIERLAHQDKLTGLTSRALFDDRLNQSCERALRNKGGFALLYLDLDEFKAVNDRFGHATGDEVLQNVALRLRRLVRRSDTVARIGGDEFCIILDEAAELEIISDVATKLVESLHAPFETKGQEIFIGTSIGISLFPDHADNPEQLLNLADAAMYQAKRNGKNSFSFAG